MIDTVPASDAPESPSLSGRSLSAWLRAATIGVQRNAESRVGLSDTSLDEAGAIAFLRRLRSLYSPLEARLGGFEAWGRFDAEGCLRTEIPGLGQVLGTLDPGRPAPLAAPRQALPHLPTFAHALGGAFAQASFLRNRPVFRTAETGPATEACSLFGACDGERLERLCEVIDRYGSERPADAMLVIEGAQRAFVAIGRWMDARHWVEARRS